ncbi:GGDEF domain-containing protein [Rhodospira trueperi]|nr:diguanylate cyclase [Rhodospira trueperi]
MAYPGPAAIIGNDGSLLDSNASARRLIPLLEPGAKGDLPGAIRLARDTKTPVLRLVPVATTGQASGLDVIAIPLADGLRVLLLGRDPVLEAALYSALADSRARYKDYVSLASDFAWETGANGRFSFIMPSDALGYREHGLLDTDPVDLLDRWERKDVAIVFQTTRPVRDVELWARAGDGRAVCLLASAMPVYDAAGARQGTRGICRDVTEQREQERALRRLHNREQVRARVVRAFRDEVDISGILTMAAEALAKGIGACGCRILRRGPAGSMSPDDDGASYPLADLIVGGDYGSRDAAPSPDALPEELTLGAQPWEAFVGTVNVMVVTTNHHQTLNGAVVVWRRAERGPWSGDDRKLIHDVADQVGIANEQINRYETIMTLSRTDALTGLLNRRAFLEDVERRHHRLERAQASSALLYLDLDNFKQVNDARGHAQGDRVLTMVADILGQRTRPTDLVARLGGDEFAVWLEDADDAVANQKARDFLEGGALLLPMSGRPDHPLALSIGIAVCDPNRPESLETLIKRADSAMYAAKLGGKGRYHLADPVEPVSRDGDGHPEAR